MPDLDLLTATAEIFTPFIGQVFDAVFIDGRLPLTLAEVNPAGPRHSGAQRDPFSIIFHGEPKLRLPQYIYRLENPAFGAAEIFLVQVEGDAGASKFEAVFN